MKNSALVTFALAPIGFRTAPAGNLELLAVDVLLTVGPLIV